MLPKLGEVRTGFQLGKPAGQKSHKYIWLSCKKCGKFRWVIIAKGYPITQYCFKCTRLDKGYKAYSAHPNWKGGISHQGNYIIVKLPHNDFFFPMASANGYVPEHRLVMARHLGRCLQPWEIVHHKDGNCHHNALSNLILTTRGNHIIEHNKGYQDGYHVGYHAGVNARIKQCEQYIQLLWWLIRNLYNNKETNG